ncbi:MAG: transglutaminase domain-containing protein [Candidatus Peregrinibacteria bacterium]
MPHNRPPEQLFERQNLREKVFLASQAGQAGVTIVPGARWALHYPEEGAARTRVLQGLLDGNATVAEAANALKPDALVYDVRDLETQDLQTVSGRVRDMTGQIRATDYRQYAEFVASLRGKDIPLGEIDDLYRSITRDRQRQNMMQAMVSESAREQLQGMLGEDARRTLDGFTRERGMQRILSALKLQHRSSQRIIDPAEWAAALSGMDPRERAQFSALLDHYTQYIETGSEESYEALAGAVRDSVGALQQHAEEHCAAEERFEEELEQEGASMPKPGMEGDLSIDADDQDEYDTRPPGEEGKGMERGLPRVLYEITPSGTSNYPVRGYFCQGRKSYFNPETKKWSKRKRLTPYSESVSGTERQTITGLTADGLKALPVHAGHAVDASSLHREGGGPLPKIFRDQNGCFYLSGSGGAMRFSIDYLKEERPFIGPPVPEDTQLLTDQELSLRTEAFLRQLTGSPVGKAEQIQRFVFRSHTYPAGGDLRAAQALQHKLRTESSPETYLPNLDRSKFLECYSTHTLFTHLCRRAGIPARIVFGHKVDGAHDGKVRITENTGHAWAEVWDSASWRRIDATPPPEPEKKKPDEEEQRGQPTPSDEADDGGLPPPDADEQLTKDVRDRTQQTADAVQSAEQATAEEVEKGKQNNAEAERELSNMEKKKQELSDRVQKAEKFEDLRKIEQDIERDHLLEDMEEEIRDKAETKREEMKENMKKDLSDMEKDGFMDAEKKEELKRALEREDGRALDALRELVEREAKKFREFQTLRREVLPMVDRWFRFFVEHLPKQEEVDRDRDTVARQGLLDQRAMRNPRNWLMGTVKNPRVVRPSVQPRFIAAVVLDISGSMKDGGKMKSARKFMVFLSELFDRIGKEFGYIRSALSVFSDAVHEVKTYEQEYGSQRRYPYADGRESTVKVRLMEQTEHPSGGTNMLEAVTRAGKDITREKSRYPDHLSALYFVGDGGDTCKNQDAIRSFLACNKDKGGLGQHMKRAVMLGDEDQRRILADLFGDANTTVADSFEGLVQRSMQSIAHDIEAYMKRFEAPPS